MRAWIIAARLTTLALAACSSSHTGGDAGSRADATPRDAGWDVGTHQAELDVSRLGRCEPDEEAACGCIDGFRRTDLCDDPCPTGWAPATGGVCRARDADRLPDADGSGFRSFDDVCAFNIDDDEDSAEGIGGLFCMTGKVCAVGLEDTGLGVDLFAGFCYPVSFCKAAAVADPPAPQVRCVYSDGTPVIDGPPAGGSCPASDPREPYCGGPCGDYLRCPDPNPRPTTIFSPQDPSEPGPCVGLSETRNLGVCTYRTGRCARGRDSLNRRRLVRCADWYGEPCAILVTHPQLDEAHFEQGYPVLTSLCRDYAARFPDSAECVDAAWNPLPP